MSLSSSLDVLTQLRDLGGGFSSRCPTLICGFISNLALRVCYYSNQGDSISQHYGLYARCALMQLGWAVGFWASSHSRLHLKTLGGYLGSIYWLLVSCQGPALGKYLSVTSAIQTMLFSGYISLNKSIQCSACPINLAYVVHGARRVCAL